jgi:hypothetical protein
MKTSFSPLKKTSFSTRSHSPGRTKEKGSYDFRSYASNNSNGKLITQIWKNNNASIIQGKFKSFESIGLLLALYHEDWKHCHTRWTYLPPWTSQEQKHSKNAINAEEWTHNIFAGKLSQHDLPVNRLYRLRHNKKFRKSLQHVTPWQS